MEEQYAKAIERGEATRQQVDEYKAHLKAQEAQRARPLVEKFAATIEYLRSKGAE